MASGLFKVLELWSAPRAGDGEYDPSSLAVLRLPGINGFETIAIGSYSGLLKLYLPEKGQFYPSQVLFEAQLDQAILGLHAGPFNLTSADSDSPSTFAVLHPRAICFYDVNVSAPPSDGSLRTATVKLVHKYDTFGTPAANVIFGRFQGARSTCDGVCVQTLSGDLLFWEQDAFSFKTQFPNVLVPGPLCFASSNGTLVTCSAAGVVEAYKYIALAAQSEPGKVKPAWSVNVGEHALDVQYAASKPATIAVLGERSVFWLTDAGSLRLSKRFESDPMCMLCYRSTGSAVNMLVGTASRQLIVLRDAQVLWSALLDVIPAGLRLCEFGGTRGVIVALEDTGRVGCFYLGTDPAIQQRMVPEVQDLAYDRMDAEMTQLQGAIRSVLLAESEAPTVAVVELDCARPTTRRLDDGGWELTCDIRLACLSGDPIADVNLQVTAPAPFEATLAKSKVDVVGVRGVTVPLTVKCGSEGARPCHSTAVYLLATYAVNGQQRSASDSFHVPLSVLCTAIPPGTLSDEDAFDACSVRVSVRAEGGSLPPLAAVMPRLVDGVHVEGTSAAARNPDGSVVHVHNVGAEYIVAAQSLGSTWLLLDGVVLLVEEKLADGAFLDTTDMDVPLEHLFRDIDRHFEARHEIEDYVTKLDKQAQQIRAVQKRLLARFKDPKPAPLDHLDQILEMAYDTLIELTDLVTGAEARLLATADALAASVRTMLLLLRLRYRLDPGQAAVLEAALDPETVHAVEDGWEERTDAALVHLLKTCLSDVQTDPLRVKEFALPSVDVGTGPLKTHLMQVIVKIEGGKALQLS